MIRKEQLSKCKEALTTRQSELIKHVQDHFGMKYEFAQETSGELSNYDNHPSDTGSELFEREKDLALNEHAEKELEEINKALHALEEGTYGICKICGADIPYERLVAVPTTDTCIEHAKSEAFNRGRPIEEEVFSPNINPDEVTDEEQVGYDAEDAWQEVSRYGTSETPSDFYGDKEHYNDMFPNSDENVGSVEDLENILAADIHGKFTGVAPNDDKHEE
ncbi:TraR/DksA C4-type zinc finger protein [Oceanobacillus profundus]|uniref:YteA family sporulation protein n=1 Tax=Oceanobacillus profundus TaxID=372463 RepID=A0A417YEE2_9BACI|nr:TraR/DksA C4-type zinc finger protein [Oceanobacillus profundus]MCM3399028.1 TraR/DksA C4-type zinc finger protein [Oceanobacillus profundus]RHW31000.1 yteA family sporulation protein [Oceanobacillus profundus]